MARSARPYRRGNLPPENIPRHRLDAAATVPGRRVEVLTGCGFCGAPIGTDEKRFDLRCLSCGVILPLDSDLTERAHPDGILPFAVDEAAARATFVKWVASRRFAPGALRAVRSPGALAPVYLPFWSFTAEAVTDYTGERGRVRHRQVPHTTTVNGQTRTEWRTETHTEWHPAEGRVTVPVPHLFLPACSALPENISPWPLPDLVPYSRGATAATRTVAYDLEPESGFDQLTPTLAGQIDRAVKAAIGGDRQRVRDTATGYLNATYSLLLLPAWLVTYRLADREWSMLINGTTGTASGDRPYSRAKVSGVVAAAVVAVLAAASMVLLVRGR